MNLENYASESQLRMQWRRWPYHPGADALLLSLSRVYDSLDAAEHGERRMAEKLIMCAKLSKELPAIDEETADKSCDLAKAVTVE